MGRSSLWSISWLRHQMFYPYVTISAAQAQESDYLRYAMSPFSLFLSSFSGTQRILGYVRPWRIVVVDPPKTKRRSIWRSLRIGAAFAWRSDGLAFKCFSEGCRRWRHSKTFLLNWWRFQLIDSIHSSAEWGSVAVTTPRQDQDFERLKPSQDQRRSKTVLRPWPDHAGHIKLSLIIVTLSN